MFKKASLLLFILSFQCIVSQITLTHNIGTTPIETGMTPCVEDESWSKVFNLSDFGITKNEQFIISSAEVGISKSYNGAHLNLRVSGVDENFPNSKPFYLGSGGNMLVPHIDSPEIIQFNLGNSIIVPAGVEKILVTIVKTIDYYNSNSAEVVIAGTAEDTGVSWYNGCRKYYEYTSTTALEDPVPDANFYINVTGNVLKTSNYGESTTLTHNICDDIIKTTFPSCSSGMQHWARAFYLSDFGISNNEEFVINSGQIGISGHGGGATVTFHIYEIDNNFPNVFSESNLIGSSKEIQIPYVQGNNNSGTIFEIAFDTPVKVDYNVERILVVAKVGTVWGSGVIFIGGTEQDYDDSWFRGCVIGEYEKFTIVDEDLNFFINVTGDINHITNNFEMNISNICSEFLKEFSVEKKEDIASIVWDFGDPASGAENTSTDISPYHDFSVDGTYTITATITANNGNVEVLIETIEAKEPPKAYGISNLEACENTFGAGISSSFDTSKVLSQILGDQTDKVITFIDGSGNEYEVLPNPFSNTIKDKETITVQVKREDELCCLSEITFDLIVNPLPDMASVEDVYECEGDNDGFTTFDLTQIQSDLLTNGISIEFYFQDGQQISNAQLNAVVNKVVNQETITVKATNTLTNCQNQTTFKILVSPLPITNIIDDIAGCDDNSDGISEYFDTSNIKTQVLGSQTGMEVSYFDANGNQLPNPLPNPYTNTVANQEILTVRVTNTQTNCYAETFLNLRTSTNPQINKPTTIYTCNEGNGFAYFDTTTIENQLIGTQPGLLIFYLDENGNQLPSPLPASYQNTAAWSQTIRIRVENKFNSLCFSETSFDLVVNELSQIELENDYFLCDLEPYLYLTTDSKFDSWKWTFQDGAVISNSFDVNLINAGTYTLEVTENNNGITCENSFSFRLTRSMLPKIEEVKIQDISANNSIEINTSGDGNFEYSIDGVNYQDNNYFSNIKGGIYTVFVRDKDGCGQVTEEVIVIDYPKFFTPNNDGYNDFWQIKGIANFSNSKTLIFDRYGKLLTRILSNDLGWNGLYNGKQMMSNDYWFKTDLGNGRVFSGHFSLKR
jgi:gliding motility-associated-like protein